MAEPSASPVVSAIVVSFNTREPLRNCLAALLREASEVPCEIIVADNASEDGSADMVARDFPDARLARNGQNLGFAAACNRAFGLARGRHILLLNPDAVVQPGALARAVQRMESDPGIGMGGARLIGEDGSWRPSARMFPSLLNDFLTLSGLSARYARSRFFGRADRTWADPAQPARVDWVPGAFCLLRREALDRVGAFDERFFLYFEEVDLCRRLKSAGYSVWYWPDVVVVHLGGEAAKSVAGISLSAKGRQIELWRMRSKFLYYRKQHGAAAAWASLQEEALWHRLRGIKNTLARGPQSAEKACDSRRIVALLNQAWKETRGGTESPPRPWSPHP